MSTNYELTSREKEICELVALGLCNKEIAARVFLSVRTVKYHVSNAMQKLGVEDRGGVTRRFLLGQRTLGPNEWVKLTDRQQQICRMVCRGMRLMDEIPRALGIGQTATREEFRIARAVLGVSDRVTLAAYMGRHGLLSSPAEATVIRMTRAS